MQHQMTKEEAIHLLGGTTTSAAKSIGIKPQAVSQWPDVLPPRISDRVLAALARDQLKTQIKRRIKKSQGVI